MQKLYFSISEISELLGETTNILRYWEKEFPILKPKKNRKGNRTYSTKDLTILKCIKKLLRDDMLSIKDAKARLPEEIKRIEGEDEANDNEEIAPKAEINEKIEANAEIYLDEEIEAIKMIDNPENADNYQNIDNYEYGDNYEHTQNGEFIENEDIEDSSKYENTGKLSIEEDEDEPEEMFDITDSIQDIYNNYVEKDELLSFLDELLKKVKNL